jgi:MFS family permease
MAVWGSAGSGGLAAGALFGGLLTNAWGWQWVLFILVPMALLAAVCAPALLPPDEIGRRETHKGSFDVPGAVLATAGSSLLVLGLVSGPEKGWGSLRGAGSIAAGVILLAVFALAENKTRQPLIPMRLFHNRSLVTAIVVILVFQSALTGSYYLFINYLQGVLGYDALKAGLAFLPLTLISMAASLKITGILLTRWGPRATLFIGMLVNGAGMLVLAPPAVGRPRATGASYCRVGGPASRHRPGHRHQHLRSKRTVDEIRFVHGGRRRRDRPRPRHHALRMRRFAHRRLGGTSREFLGVGVRLR